MSDDVSPKKGRGRPRHPDGELRDHRFMCPDPLFDAMKLAARARGTSVSAELRGFMAWYTGEPGAMLPTRPEA